MKRKSMLAINGDRVQVQIDLHITTSLLTRAETESIVGEFQDQLVRIILSKTIPFCRVGIRNITVK